VRTAISRMKQAGYLESRRAGHRSYYRLTTPGLKEVQRAGALAFDSPDIEWDGHWTIITYSIPEEQRELRAALRIKLKMHGYGLLVPGVWISPHPISADIEEKCQELGLWGYIEIFRSEHIRQSHPNHLVAKAWPHLPALASRYRAYIKKSEQVLEQFNRETLSNERCFALHLQSLFEFMTIVLEDPTLPSSLLPQDWPHQEALSLYRETRNTLAEPAERFFDGIYKTADIFNNHG
jgi:phenylacetic acid degradation operon negative regulatory protein